MKDPARQSSNRAVFFMLIGLMVTAVCAWGALVFSAQGVTGAGCRAAQCAAA